MDCRLLPLAPTGECSRGQGEDCRSRRVLVQNSENDTRHARAKDVSASQDQHQCHIGSEERKPWLGFRIEVERLLCTLSRFFQAPSKHQKSTEFVLQSRSERWG